MKTLTQTSLFGTETDLRIYSPTELKQCTTAELVQVLLTDGRGDELQEFMSESRLRTFLIDRLAKGKVIAQNTELTF